MWLKLICMNVDRLNINSSWKDVELLWKNKIDNKQNEWH